MQDLASVFQKLDSRHKVECRSDVPSASYVDPDSNFYAEGEPAYLPWWVWAALTVIGIGAWIGLGYIVGAIVFAVLS